jgi:hypothetical protein
MASFLKFFRAGVVAGLAGTGTTSLAAAAEWHGPIPDLSGVWEGPGFDLAPPEKPNPGPVTNASKDIQQPEGDYNNPILQPWAAAVVKRWAEETHAGRAPPHAHALCYPTSVPGVMTLHQGYQFLQQKDKVTILVNNQSQVRHIYLNVPHASAKAASWYGESVGHYEGDTLVVDTVGIKTMDVVPFDRFGTPHTDRLHVVERIRKTGAASLRIDYRVEDPGVFTAPWDASLTFHPFKEGWGEDPCAENNVDVTGKLLPGLPVDLHPAF